jgi:hypothetical protein
MQARSREIDCPRAIAVALFKGMNAVEPYAPRAFAIGVEIRQRPHMPAAVPLLAGSGASVTADANIEIDDETELFPARA